MLPTDYRYISESKFLPAKRSAASEKVHEQEKEAETRRGGENGGREEAKGIGGLIIFSSVNSPISLARAESGSLNVKKLIISAPAAGKSADKTNTNTNGIAIKFKELLSYITRPATWVIIERYTGKL